VGANGLLWWMTKWRNPQETIMLQHANDQATATTDEQVVRATLDALNGDGVEAALAYFDPQVEWLAPPEWLEEHLYKGHDGVRRLAGRWHETFDDYRLDLEEIIDAGDHLVALVTRRGRMKRSGDLLEQRIAYHWNVRHGKAVRLQAYFSWEEALAAVEPQA
jgi:uncharacterized protein